MKVILTEDLENLGTRGTLVEVKDGYGRNYLIPRRLAVVATKGNVARVGEDERLFGTVTTQQIADELARQGYDVDRRKITLDEEIRTTGVFPATVRVHPLFSAQVKVQVVPEEASL